MLDRAPNANRNAPGARAAAPVSAAEAAALFADLAVLPGLLLAISGGADSTALMLLLARWQKGLANPPRLVAATVDHGLRPQAAHEAQAVKRLAERLGIKHHTLRWTGPKPATGLQEAARVNRYRLLAKLGHRQGLKHVLTAHTEDDQAETVLFRLLRGSGIAGLSGIARITPFADLVLIRPLLEVSKARLIATLNAESISFIEDPSNADPRFTRVRLRRILPALAAEGLSSSRLAGFARRMARAQQALEACTEQAYARCVSRGQEKAGEIVLERSQLMALPAEIGLRVLGRAIVASATAQEVELGKLETLWKVVATANGGPQRLFSVRRTLAGAIITVAGDKIRVKPAPPRRAVTTSRGRASA